MKAGVVALLVSLIRLRSHRAGGIHRCEVRDPLLSLVLAAWMSGRPLAPLLAVPVCLPVPSPHAGAGFLLLVSHRIL